MRKAWFSAIGLATFFLVLVPVVVFAVDETTPLRTDTNVVPTASPAEDPNAPNLIAPTPTAEEPNLAAIFANVEKKDVFKADETVLVTEDVYGDLFAFGSNIQIDGMVANDVIAAGGDVTINGPVYGDVRVAGGTVEITGQVFGNVTIAGGTLFFNSHSPILGSVIMMGGTATFNSDVYGDISGGVGNLVIDSQVKNVDVEVDTLVLGPNAAVTGDLTYKASAEASITNTAVVMGETNYEKVTAQKETTKDTDKGATWSFGDLTKMGDFKFDSDHWSVINFAGFLSKMAFAILIGLLIWWVAPKFLKEIQDYMMKEPWPSIGWGLLWMILLPVIGVAIAITIIGIPVAIVWFIAYSLGIFIARLVTAYLLGNLIVKSKKKQGEAIGLIVGILILYTVFAIPWFGGLIEFVATLLGFGGLLIVLKRRWDERKAKKAKAKK